LQPQHHRWQCYDKKAAMLGARHTIALLYHTMPYNRIKVLPTTTTTTTTRNSKPTLAAKMLSSFPSYFILFCVFLVFSSLMTML